MQLLKSIPLTKSFKRLNDVVGIVFVIAILSHASVAQANEHGAAPAEGAAPSAVKEKPACRYTEHESRLTSYMTKIRGFEKEIADMIHEKHHIENSEKVKLLTQQIAFKHSDLAKVVRDYESERLHVRFQHPDRDMEGDRKYTALKLKSLDEIEAAFGLDGRLDRVRKQVGIVFPAAPSEKASNKRHPASVNAHADDDDDVPKNIHLVK